MRKEVIFGHCLISINIRRPRSFIPYQKLIIFLCFVFFSNLSWAQKPVHLFIGLSGGYGQSSDAYANTGTNGLIRFAFGSLWHIKPQFILGSQLGFQTGSQTRLRNQITEIMGAGNVPTVLNTKTPIDFLLAARYVLHGPLFFHAKGGVAFISSTVSGADVSVNSTWVPESQVGLGFIVTKRSRVTFSYQNFFGKTVEISPVDVTEGTYRLTGAPSWQAVLLTFEHDL